MQYSTIYKLTPSYVISWQSQFIHSHFNERNTLFIWHKEHKFWFYVASLPKIWELYTSVIIFSFLLRRKFNCFINRGFPDLKLDKCDINYQNDVNEREDEDWNPPRIQITFKEYMNFDTSIMTSELFTVGEL